MKTINYNPSNQLTGLASITFRPAERGNMLLRLEWLRQKAVHQIANQPKTKLGEAKPRTAGRGTKNQEPVTKNQEPRTKNPAYRPARFNGIKSHKQESQEST